MEADESTPLTQYPPEGVEWHNRWAELENAYALLESQNESLQKKVLDLQGALQEKVQDASKVDDDELLQQKIELQQQVDRLLGEEVRKEEKIARLAKDLEKQTETMSEMSRAKFQMEYEKSRTQSEMLPLTAQRDRLQKEKEMKDRMIDDLRKELASSRDEQDKLFREKFEVARDLRRELQAAKAETSYQQQMAEDALQAQYREKKLKEELERKVKDLSEDFAAKKATLEDQKRISDDRATRMDENWKQTQAQLAETVADLKTTCQARDEVSMELQTVKTQLQEQLLQYQSLKQEHEDFLRRRIPGADTGELPNGYESLSELVRIAQTSREEALQERAAKDNLQQVLQDIEREIRQRYPVLMSQNQELKELRAQNAELKEQNRIIYQKAREYATYNRDAEARAQRSEHSEKIIEGHAQDLTRQLAVLLYEKNRRSNVNLAASRLTWFQLTKADEEDEWPLSSVQEMVEQNVALRKAMRQLEARCQEEDSKEKELMDEREQQLEDELEKKAEELKELTGQLQELKETLQDVSQHRDAALRKVKSLEVAQPAAPLPTGAAATPAAPPEDPVKIQRQAAREEELRSQVLELQSAATEASRSLAKTEATLDFERQRRSDVEESSKQLKKELKETQERVNQQAKFIEDLREEKCIEERKLREAHHALQSAQSSKGEVDALLRSEEAKVSTLEKTNAMLLTEKQMLEREVAAQQSRLEREVAAQQSRSSQERDIVKKELEEQYKKQEELFMTLSKKSQENIDRLEASLVESRQKEAQEVSVRLKEEQIAKLEAKISTLQRENGELRLRGARSSAEVVAEAEAQLDRSEHQPLKPSERGDLRLAQAAEREEQHLKTVETWKNLLAQQSADLRDSKAEQERLEKELMTLKAQVQQEREKMEDTSSRDQAKAMELNVQLDESRSQVLALRSQLEASNAELETAKLDWDQKMRDSSEEVSRLEREKKDLQEQRQKAEQKYQEEVKLHATDAKELGSAQERLTELDRNCLQLKHQVADLERETVRARKERKEELTSVRKRMEQAERHAKNLSEENARYRDQTVALNRGETTQQEVLLEMKKAREIGELERRRLELQKTQIEEDEKALRVENQSLREQLANEQRENVRLQKDCQLETQSRAKLLQIDMIEDENCRLDLENKAMKIKVEEAEKRADLTTNPLVQELEVIKKRSGELESELNLHKGRSEEYKSMYEACKFKEDDIKKWEVQEGQLKSKVTALEEKLTSVQGKLAEEQKANQELTKVREDLQSSLKSKETEYTKQASALRSVQALKELHTKRLHDMEEETKKLTEENRSLRIEGKKLAEEETKKVTEENRSLRVATKKLEEEVKQLQKHADTALHLSMEYRTAVEVLLPEVEKKTEAPRAPVAPVAAPAAVPAAVSTPAAATPPPKEVETPAVAKEPAKSQVSPQAQTSTAAPDSRTPKESPPTRPPTPTPAPPTSTAIPPTPKAAALDDELDKYFGKDPVPTVPAVTVSAVTVPAVPAASPPEAKAETVKRKDPEVPQQSQVERAAKAARSEGPPVKKQPVPPKAAPVSSTSGAAASTAAPVPAVSTPATGTATTPVASPAASPALMPKVPIEIMDVDEEEQPKNT